MSRTNAHVISIFLALLVFASTAAAQQWEPPPEPPPDPDSWNAPPPPPPPPPAEQQPPAYQPVPSPAPPAPQPATAPAAPRRVAYSGLRDEADVAPQDVEFLESIVLSALIPLTGKGFEIIPDDNASKFCGDACTISLALQNGFEFVVHGSIAIFAGGYTVTLKAHRVATSELLHSSTTDSRPLLGELVGPTEVAAAALVRALETAQPPPPPAPPPPPPPPPVAPTTDPGYWWPTEPTESDEEKKEPDGRFPYPTRGLDFELRAGLNFCAESGEAKCENFEMGGGGGAFVGVRFVPMFAAGIDFGVYGLKLKDTLGASDVTVSSRTFMLSPRLYLPFRIVEIYFAIGFLYHGFYEKGERDGESYSVRISSWASFKIGAGLTFYVVRGKRVGDIGLGADLSYSFLSPKDVELCGGAAEGRNCDEQSWGSYTEDLETSDMVDFMQFTLHLSWLIPVF